MKEETKSTEGTPENAEGSNQSNNQTNSESSNDKLDGKPVAWESYDKVVKNTKKLEGKYRDAISELNEIKNSIKNKEEAKLAEKGEFQKLLELREQENANLKEQLEAEVNEKKQTANALEDTWKLQAFYNKLPGKLENQKYLSHVDLDSIVYNHETGQVDQQSVDMAVNKFMEEHPKLVDTSHFGRLPSNAAKGAKFMDRSSFRDLPLKDMRKNITEAVREAKRKQGVN